MIVSLWLGLSAALVAAHGCSGDEADNLVVDDDASTDTSRNPSGGNTTSGGASGALPGSSSGNADGGTSGTTTSSGGPTPGGEPVGTCDPACTGSKMCNADACVCAPGWEANGTECVAGTVTDPTTRSKAEVCARYAEAKAAPGVLYTPPAGGDQCAVAALPYATQIAALSYLNFYRWMVGVGPVQVVPNEGQAQQECAKILEKTFGHDPPTTAPCYTALGAGACGRSLIARGFTAITQFDGYGMEVEQNLVHRRNILAVGRAGVWIGSTGNASDMRYGGAYPALASDPAYVAHPGPGLNVRQRVPARWFVQKGTATIAAVDARVTEVASGTVRPMKRNHHYTDFSSFDPDGWQPQADIAYKVELVNDASQVVGTFTTTLIDCP